MKLKECGMGDSCTPRSERVVAKGKGAMQTYWLSTAVSESAPNTTKQLKHYDTALTASFSDDCSIDTMWMSALNVKETVEV
jgi:hypothetical protein